MAMGIYVGAGSVKTVSGIYVGAGGVKTVKEVYVGAGGVQKVWPAGTYIFDGNTSNWTASVPNSYGTTSTGGSIQSYGLQIASAYSSRDWSGSGVGSYSNGTMQYVQFYNTAFSWPSTLDDYSYFCIEYNVGDPSNNDTTSYSRYIGFDAVFRSSGSYDHVGNYKYEVSGGGTYKIEITSSIKSSYNNRMNSSSYSTYQFKVGGWNNYYSDTSGDDDWLDVYYNRGYITAIWMEE